MAFSSITAEEFDRMSVEESHALAAEVQHWRMVEFKAWVDVFGNFLTALVRARAV